jgi:hypothetical protein
MRLIDLALDKDQWQNPANIVMNFWDQWNVRKFLVLEGMKSSDEEPI